MTRNRITREWLRALDEEFDSEAPPEMLDRILQRAAPSPSPVVEAIESLLYSDGGLDVLAEVLGESDPHKDAEGRDLMVVALLQVAANIIER